VSNGESYLLLVAAVHVVVYHGSTFVASELFLVADCSNVVHEVYCSAPLECGMKLAVRTSHRSVEVPLRRFAVYTYPPVFTVFREHYLLFVNSLITERLKPVNTSH
jgi:hypothetical protein